MKKLILLSLLAISVFASQRIVNLAPSVNEIVFALGKGENVVANTMFCDYPEESKTKEKIGGYSSISLEKILKNKPSIVIAQNYDEKLNSNLKKLGIETRVYKTTTLNNIKDTILDLGEYFNKQNKANKLVDNINSELKSLDGIIENNKILIVISPKKDLKNQIYVTGNFLYFEDIINASNNKNAYRSNSTMQPVVNAEKIISMNPDIIILLGAFFENKPKELEVVKNAWRNLPINAAKQNNIYAIDKEYAGIPSHRVVYFIKDFRKILEDVRNKRLQ
jgi:iron complex transport system substrate-binding protein